MNLSYNHAHKRFQGLLGPEERRVHDTLNRSNGSRRCLAWGGGAFVRMLPVTCDDLALHYTSQRNSDLCKSHNMSYSLNALRGDYIEDYYRGY